jgi:hypothetical protein
MPRFAIVAHDHPAPHWDLFLESGDSLRSWRILEPFAPGQTVRVEPAPDHRLMYLDYEGPVSGGRGTVKRICAGVYAWEEDAASRVVIRLEGQVFAGRLTLTRASDGWTATFEPATSQ